MNKEDKIYVAGSNGLVGSAVIRLLKLRGFTNILTTPRVGQCPIDLRSAEQVRWWFSCHEPEYIFLCAARTGGIKDNIQYPLAFFQDNLAIQQNVMENAWRYKTKKLLFLGSNCMYPRDCPQPIKEEYLLTGPLEKTNEPYALAKIMGVKLCQWYRQMYGCNFVSAMPCNLYGPNDRFHPEYGHLVPSMMARMHAAKLSDTPEFKAWGRGTARRELLFSDDLAEALLLVMEKYDSPEPINAGSSDEHAIRPLAEAMKTILEYPGELVFDVSEPVGVKSKLLNNHKIRELGWKPRTGIYRGLDWTYQDFLNNPEGRKT